MDHLHRRGDQEARVADAKGRAEQVAVAELPQAADEHPESAGAERAGTNRPAVASRRPALAKGRTITENPNGDTNRGTPLAASVATAAGACGGTDSV
jgi:hypothetical protein